MLTIQNGLYDTLVYSASNRMFKMCIVSDGTKACYAYNHIFSALCSYILLTTSNIVVEQLRVCSAVVPIPYDLRSSSPSPRAVALW